MNDLKLHYAPNIKARVEKCTSRRRGGTVAVNLPDQPIVLGVDLLANVWSQRDLHVQVQ